MKDRIKKYYENHKEEIIALSISLGVTSACVATGMYAGYLRGKRVVDVEGLWSGSGSYDDGESYDGFRVLLTNGKEGFFFPPATQEAA